MKTRSLFLLNVIIGRRLVMDKEKTEIPKEIPVFHLDQSDLSADWIKEMSPTEDEKIKEELKKRKEFRG